MKTECKKIFYISGRLQSATRYVDGKMNGVRRTYWENGRLRDEVCYVNDLMEGKREYYSQEGHRNYIKHYSKGEQKGANQHFFYAGSIGGIRDDIRQMIGFATNGVCIRFRYNFNNGN